jgi:general secretion pathway protein C
MSARWWTLVVWALVAGSALFWGLKLVSRPLPVPPQTLVAEPGAALRGDLTRLLGEAHRHPLPKPHQ